MKTPTAQQNGSGATIPENSKNSLGMSDYASRNPQLVIRDRSLDAASAWASEIAGEPVRLVWTSSRNALALALLGWTMFDREAAECGMDPKF